MRSSWWLGVGLLACVGLSCAADDDCGPTSDWPLRNCSEADGDDNGGEGMSPVGPSMDAGTSGGGTRDAGRPSSCVGADGGVPEMSDGGAGDAGDLDPGASSAADDASVGQPCLFQGP